MEVIGTLFPESPPQVVDGVTLKFPAKLWRIVNGCKTGAIAWEPDGESIRVDRRKFEDQYLKTGVFFKTTNFQSFIRQLNIYGFRKLPTNGPRSQQDGACFIYKHDYFKQGHPDILSEVVRNTAVRRTQRENSIREVEAKHGKLEDLHTDFFNGHHQKKIVESHPLLKCPAETVRYGVQVEPTQTIKSKITTVYLNPRVGMCDMQRMSPTKLHHQVTDLLAAINDDEDRPPYKRPRQSQAITVCRPFKDWTSVSNEPSTTVTPQAQFPLTIQTSMSNQILFVPNPCNKQSSAPTVPTNMKEDIRSANNEHTRNFTIDHLSQESGDSQSSLMFPCPVDNDDDDDDLESVFRKTLDSPCDFESMATGDETGGKSLDFEDHCTPSVFDSESFNMENSMTNLGDEQGFLTPAYYDPDTGTVTLLLPPMNPEY